MKYAADVVSCTLGAEMIRQALIPILVVAAAIAGYQLRPPSGSDSSNDSEGTSTQVVDLALDHAQQPSRAEPEVAVAGGMVAPAELGVAAGKKSGEAEPSESSWRATSHPHGEQICASGCALSRHPTPELTDAHFRDLVLAYSQQQDAAAVSDSLDALIFFGAQTNAKLRQSIHSDVVAELPAGHAEHLARENARTHLVVEIRVLDDAGDVRVALPPTRVPQHIRQEFAMSVTQMQPTVTSGTVKRVGQKHCWQRL